MPFFAATSQALTGRATSLAGRRLFATSKQAPKSWFEQWVKPPARPMTAGEYLFLKITRTSALGLGAFGIGVVAPLYLMIHRPYPPLMLKRMAELPPADAERLFLRETEPLPPGYKLH